MSTELDSRAVNPEILA